MGTQPRAATSAITQNPRRNRSGRCSRPVNRNRPTEGTNSTMLYLARMPAAVTSPAAGHAHHEPRKTARCASTSAQPQQQVYGASMVISAEPAASTGKVRPRTSTPRARRSLPYTWTVRT
jgi:hypothetical protein